MGCIVEGLHKMRTVHTMHNSSPLHNSPVAFQSVRLNEQEVVMGSAVLEAKGVSASLVTWLMPWVASDHLMHCGAYVELDEERLGETGYMLNVGI